MIESLVYKVIGTPSERRLKKLTPVVDQINALEPEMQKLAEADFPARTEKLRERLRESMKGLDPKASREDRIKYENEALSELIPEAFALTREASRRVTGLRHYDVQMLGGMVLNECGIAEMKTGEGKTLVATTAVYLNSLGGRGVHVVTVNDYLARRDSEWMGPIYRYLGLSVGVVQHDIDNQSRREAYNCDVTYVTNNEIGFDYLRDNMVNHRDDRVLRPLHYAVVDEVDSILVDEARTPLIISGPAEESTDRYKRIDEQVIPFLKVRFVTEEEEIQAKYTNTDLGKDYDAVIDEKNHNAVLTDQGIEKAQHLLGLTNLYDDLEGAWVHHITQALRAHHLYKRDVEYVVKAGETGPEVIIVDEFTGRLMPGRRWSDGLHQAVEAKEKIPPREENQTLATITFQNFFKMYEKLSGMTGTAMTEADEFFEIYKLSVVEIPTNRVNIRNDYPDIIYLNQRGKWRAIVADIEATWRKSRPILVGTRSIEKSESLAAMLREKGIPHQVLNAKYHEMEAQIIAQAGKKGTVTIATNMAGRGTDIILGGSPTDLDDQKSVLKVGGLYVMGTERHEARRIDNQLRGRCGRQGDPGETRFYLALDDELMRLFGSERIQGLMVKFGMTEDEPIESPLVTSQIEGAQRRVETHNFDIRKQLLDYDNVMNKQREVVYGLRNFILDGETVTEQIRTMLGEDIEVKIAEVAPKDTYADQWDMVKLEEYTRRVFGLESQQKSEDELRAVGRDGLTNELRKAAAEAYERRAKEDFAGFRFEEIEKLILLQRIDQNWKNHLYELDHLKKSIHLRAYGQKDPKIEYQKETKELFDGLLDRIREQTIEYLFHIQVPRRVAPPPVVHAVHPDAGGDGDQPDEAEQQAPAPGPARSRLLKGGGQAAAAAPAQPVSPVPPKIGRNDPCPCGSGKKYKKCCGGK